MNENKKANLVLLIIITLITTATIIISCTAINRAHKIEERITLIEPEYINEPQLIILNNYSQEEIINGCDKPIMCDEPEDCDIQLQKCNTIRFKFYNENSGGSSELIPFITGVEYTCIGSFLNDNKTNYWTEIMSNDSITVNNKTFCCYTEPVLNTTICASKEER
jgi:hypothetical protein